MNDDSTIRRFGTTTRWSDLVAHRGTAYFVEVPDDPSVGPREQFVQLLAQVDERLALVGSSRQRLLQVLIYLPDPNDLPVFNDVWDAWVPTGCAPVRACVRAELMDPTYRAELVVTAACD